jgi:hypothetical protein
MPWEDTTVAVTLNMPDKDTLIVSSIFEFNPGESCSIELVRTDATPVDDWTWAILEAVENNVAALSDIPSPRKRVSASELTVVFPHDALGSRFFAIEVNNAEVVTTEPIETELRLTFDGVDLSV